nr:hypothetical protein [Mesobacillus harenae]
MNFFNESVINEHCYRTTGAYVPYSYHFTAGLASVPCSFSGAAT